MPRGTEPLLARSDTDNLSTSSSQRAEEEDALLSGTSRQSKGSQWHRGLSYGLAAWALIVTIAMIVLAVLLDQSQRSNSRLHEDHHGRPKGKRNLVFMVSDGMGPASLSLTRSFRQYVDGLPEDDTLVIDDHLIGQSRTRSSSSLVTDSAAGATAFSCGIKSYNGAISVDPDFMPCGSVMEAAKRAGYMTGLVVTTAITDATPACFASHVRTRSMQDDIAVQLIGEGVLGRSVDLILGGGRCHFLRNGTAGSCRLDDDEQLDVVEMAQSKGWSYIDNKDDFDGLNLGSAVDLPLLGLFARYNMPFMIDRQSKQGWTESYPTLEEMTQTAIKALSDATRDSDKGFFLMVEGSRIDHGGHLNDPAAQVHEVLAYDKAMSAVLDFFDRDDEPGLMVATSDHETGGLSVAYQQNKTYPEYYWKPEVLAEVSHSAEFAAHYYHHHLLNVSSTSEYGTYEAVLPVITSGSVEEQELREKLDMLVVACFGFEATHHEITTLVQDPTYAVWYFGDMISKRAQVGWSTHGHSAADVNIYASSPKLADKLRGNHENTEVGKFLRWWLDVEDGVEDITEELHEKMGRLDGPIDEDAKVVMSIHGDL